jgi:hypothetical protein
MSYKIACYCNALLCEFVACICNEIQILSNIRLSILFHAMSEFTCTFTLLKLAHFINVTLVLIQP